MNLINHLDLFNARICERFRGGHQLSNDDEKRLDYIPDTQYIVAVCKNCHCLCVAHNDPETIDGYLITDYTCSSEDLK